METPKRYLSWLTGLSLGVLLALLLWPATRGLVTTQLQMILPICSPLDQWNNGTGLSDNLHVASSVQRATHETAMHHPDNYLFQLVDALSVPFGNEPLTSATKIVRLRALEVRFPENPSLYANILRYASQGEVLIHRDEENIPVGRVSQSNKANGKSQSATPEQLAAFDHDAAEGERLDPNNAYFPLMRSVGYFAAHRDTEALAAIARAAQKTTWKEYYNDELEGERLLFEATYGHMYAMPRMAQAAALLFPQYANLRGAGRVATYMAVEAEHAGHLEEGLAIRHNLQQCASLMRAQGQNAISALVGIAIFHLSMTRPGGVPAKSHTEEGTNATKNLIPKYVAYLQRIGHGDESANIHAEEIASDKVRDIVRRGVDIAPFGISSILKLSGSWALNLVLLANAFWILVLGGMAVLLKRHSWIRSGQGFPHYARRGCTIAVIAAMVLAGTAILQNGALGPEILLTILVLAGLFVVSVPGYTGADRLRGLGAFGAALTGMATLGAVFLWQAVHGGTGMIAQLVQNMGYGGGQPGSFQAQMLLWLGIAAVLAVPLLTLLTLGVLSLIWRLPLTVGLVRGLHGCAIPITCLLVVGYAISVPLTLRQESIMQEGLRRSAQHEGRYFAELCRTEWPGAVH